MFPILRKPTPGTSERRPLLQSFLEAFACVELTVSEEGREAEGGGGLRQGKVVHTPGEAP